MSSKTCGSCSALVPANAKFCKECGLPFRTSTPAIHQPSPLPRRQSLGRPEQAVSPLNSTDNSTLGTSESSHNGTGSSSGSNLSSPDNCSVCGTTYTPKSAKFCSSCGHSRGGTVLQKRQVDGNDMEPKCGGCGWVFAKEAAFCISCGTVRRKSAPAPTPVDDLPGMSTAQYTSLDLLKMFFVTPDSLKNWTKGPLLGRGSFATVYQGLLTNGGFVAVKVIELPNPETGWEKNIKALHRELAVLTVLEHPNICRYLGAEYNQECECVNLFMEFVTGGSLASIIKRFKSLPIPVVRNYTRDIMNGLSYLHSNNVIHRDIKGDNILIDQEKGRAKLADFGAAKRLVDHARTMVGTPYWMAPEVITQPEGYGSEADIWSSACTIVEMLTGKPPWPMQNTPQQAMLTIARGTKPTEIPKDIDPQLLQLLDSCFEATPSSRPTAAQLLSHVWLTSDGE